MLSGAATFAAIALHMSGLLGPPRPSGQLPAFQERVVVTAARIDEDLFRPIAGGAIGRGELVALGGDAVRAIEVASSAAGAFVGSRRVRRDGLGGSLTPPGAAAGSVSIQTDPFSVEYGGLDQIDMDVELTPPSRTWTFNVAPPAVRAGGDDPLAGGAPRIRRLGAFAGGPVPRTALTFFAQGDRFEHRQAVPFAGPGGGVIAGAADGVTRTQSTSAAFGVAWAGRAGLVRATVLSGSTAVANAGIGGLSTPGAAFSLATVSRHAQISWNFAGRLRHRGGAAYRRGRIENDASGAAPARISPELVRSGSDLRRGRTETGRWTIRHVTHAPSQRWLAGVEFSRDALAETRLYGEDGILRQGTDGRSTLTQIVALDDVSARVTSGAAFAQTIVPLGRAAGVRAGMRADWLKEEGLFLSPRVSFGARIGGTLISAAVALSAEEWTASHLAGLEWRDASVASWKIDGRPLGLRIDPGFRRRRDLITRVGAARRLGRVTAGIEQTWTRGAYLTGATRAFDGAALVDTLASDRRLARSQTHVTARASAGPLAIVTHYERVRAHDDSDGWLSLPARQDALLAEWGRSAGVARHHASVVVTGRIWQAVQLVAAARAASGTPYGVLSGLDPEGLGAFTDRAGWKRNSHETAGWASINVYLSRSFRIPGVPAAGVDVGLRLENVLNTTRADEAGRVLGTPIFGVPLSAAPGRAAGIWLSLARRAP